MSREAVNDSPVPQPRQTGAPGAGGAERREQLPAVLAMVLKRRLRHAAPAAAAQGWFATGSPDDRQKERPQSSSFTWKLEICLPYRTHNVFNAS